MIKRRILRNRIRCRKCGEIIESFTRNDIKFCKCGAVGVDGGRDYIRRCGDRNNYDDLSEFKDLE